ncbi:SpoIID/LytB domain-containing protein [bacterium]|nr:SpoIID/LytB domain-containing protein [bacterium]
MKSHTILFCALFSFTAIGCSPTITTRSLPDNASIPQVKILIQKTPTVSLYANAAFAVKDNISGQDIGYVSAEQRIELRRSKDKIEVFDATGKSIGVSSSFSMDTKSTSIRFSVGGNSYRGSLLLLPEEDKINVINILDMESYLMGVVRNEIGNLMPDQLEAAKAQAVAARTYAVRYKNKYKQYDYVSDVNDQVYEGASSESDITTRAVIETIGEIAIMDGKPINAFYFSTCGGITANVQEVWKSSAPTAYLVSINNEVAGKNLCEDSPNYRWELNWTGDEIEKLIKENLKVVIPQEEVARIDNQRLYNLAVMSRDSSQRVKEFKIGFTKDSFIVSGEQARRILRGEKYILYSSLFRLDIMRNPDGTIHSVKCRGAGFGHGVGMCQYSARTMAKQGYTYKQILQFFYRGAELGKSY